MRLSVDQQSLIQHIVRAHLGDGAEVSVFGSRIDDAKRGGDVDLFIEAPRHVSLLQRAALKMELEEALFLPVDVLISEADKPLSAFQSISESSFPAAWERPAMTDRLEQERRYLSQLLEAVQRCVYFLDHSERKIDWPLQGSTLAARQKDTELFETLAAINERFAKLQDTLSVSMRHTALLMGEQTDSFLKILAFFEKSASLVPWKSGNKDGWHAILRPRVRDGLRCHRRAFQYPGSA